MKILYAANDNYHSKLQLERFIQNIDHKKYNIKYAGYKDNLPNYEIDFTLNFLLKDNKYLFKNNRCLDLYQKEIESFGPDLIISDMELYTSIIANKLKIKLWNVSNQLFNFGIYHLYKNYINFHKYYSLFSKDVNYIKIYNSVIDGAENNYIYSHFGDMVDAPVIDNKYKWIRPYYVKSNISIPCKHDYVAVDNDKKDIINYIKTKRDSVLFTICKDVNYKELITKSIFDIDEYSCNMVNSEYFVCDANPTYLADSFYNNKKTIIIPDLSQKDNLFNYLIYKNIYNYTTEKEIIHPLQVDIKNEIKYLHQEIEALT